MVPLIFLKEKIELNDLNSGKHFTSIAVLLHFTSIVLVQYLNHPYKMGVGICIRGQFAYDFVQQKQI